MAMLDTKIPPPVVGLFFAVVMWFASGVVDSFSMPFGIRVAMGLVLLVIGQCISFAGIRSFRKAKTTINPLKPNSASALVSGGIYQFTRNPMYVGLTTTLIGWAAFLLNPLAFVLVPFFILYITVFQIIPEERALLSLFGAEYEA